MKHEDVLEAALLRATVNGFDDASRATRAPEVSRLIAIIAKHRRLRRQKAETG